MQLIKMIRAVEWWDYKLPPVLAAAYMVLSSGTFSLLKTASLLLFIICSLIIGAIYVSLINDITDIEEDRLAGKNNRMAAYDPVKRILFLCAVLLLAIVCCMELRNHTTSLYLYIGCYAVFTLYSVPPFRLKTRGLAGIIADATGSQWLPTLYAACLVADEMHLPLQGSQVLLISTWSFCFGLRGILWHQFHDLQNDIKSGLSTWVQTLDEKQTRTTGITLIIVEITSLLLLLGSFNQFLCFISLSVYLLYLAWRRKKTAVEIVLFKYRNANYCIFMNEYYQVFLPITILIVLTWQQPQFALLLICHLLIFPMGWYRVLRNVVN